MLKKLSQIPVLLISVVISLHPGFAHDSKALTISATTSLHDSPIAVSMIHLIASPDAFEGLKVRVLGYVGGLSSSTLFLTREHSEAGDSMSSIHLSLESNNKPFSGESCDGFYTYVTGTVKARKFKLYSLISLVDVEKIRIASNQTETTLEHNCYIKQ